jgi:hypothetical protein
LDHPFLQYLEPLIWLNVLKSYLQVGLFSMIKIWRGGLVLEYHVHEVTERRTNEDFAYLLRDLSDVHFPARGTTHPFDLRSAQHASLGGCSIKSLRPPKPNG